jgi:hypothetical protein
MTILNKGLKYNLNHKKTHWLRNLAFEAENAISLLPTQEQDFMRYQIAHNIEILHRQEIKPHQKNKSEYRTMNRIKEKLETGKAIITRADKGNSIIIIYAEEYIKKVSTFITDNNFHKATNDITKELQRDIKNTINNCQTIIPKENRRKNINLNPTTPSLKGLIKIHKPEAPIRPVVNWRNAPAYKAAKTLTKNLHKYIPLPYCFNVKNSTHLIEDLHTIPYDHNLRLASFDITNMYQNPHTRTLDYNKRNMPEQPCKHQCTRRHLKTH